MFSLHLEKFNEDLISFTQPFVGEDSDVTAYGKYVSSQLTEKGYTLKRVAKGSDTHIVSIWSSNYEHSIAVHINLELPTKSEVNISFDKIDQYISTLGESKDERQV